MAPKYILNYFNTTGRAEPLRLMFHAAGIEFTDVRMDREEWAKNKSDAKRFPLGQMPSLQVDDYVICQAQAIARYLARELGFYGNSSCEQAMIDQICETFFDFAMDGYKIQYGGFDEETMKKKLEEHFASDKTKAHLTFMNNFAKNNSSGSGFFVGNKPSYADFLLFGAHEQLTLMNPAYLDNYPEMKTVIDRVSSIENLKNYLESQKK